MTMNDQFRDGAAEFIPGDKLLDAVKMKGLYANYYEQVAAQLPQLFLKLVDRVEALEKTVDSQQQTIDELEHQVRKLRQQQ